MVNFDGFYLFYGDCSLTRASDLRPKARGRRTVEDESGRAAILAAAVPAFGRYGFEGTSVRQLAKVAGVDASLVGHLFGSKLGLWRAVLGELLQELSRDQAFFDSLQSDAPAKVRLETLIHWIIERCKARPYFGIVVLRESLLGGERLEVLVSTLLQPLYGKLEAFLEEVVQSEEVVCASASELYSSLFDGVASRIAGEGLYRVMFQASQPASDELLFDQIRRAVYRAKVEVVPEDGDRAR